MAEKLDLDALARLASGSYVSGYNAVEAKDVLRLIARIRALESRASNAGGAVAAGHFVLRNGLWYDVGPEHRMAQPLYTHPAPASKEPVADERAAFEAWAEEWFFGGLVRCGDGYDLNSINAAWYAWQARAALATAQTVPEGILDALRFYANGSHFTMHDSSAWDTVSGEPQNFYEDESNTATVEDGSIAKLALQGKFFPDAEYQEPAVEGEVFAAAPAKPEGV